MKKVIALILTLIVCMTIFVGCGDKVENVNNDAFPIPDRFVRISYDKCGIDSYDYCVYADKQTGVMYWAVIGYEKFGITALLNADGTPMRYDFDTKEIIEKEVND